MIGILRLLVPQHDRIRTHLLKLEELAVSLELAPGRVQLIIAGGKGSVQRLLVAELGGKGGVLISSANHLV